MGERMALLREQILGLKERIEGLRQAKEDDIDWATMGVPSGSGGAKFALRVRRQLRGHNGRVYALDWAGDNTSLVSAAHDGRLIVWNAFTEAKRAVVTLASPWVLCTAFEREDSCLVAAGGLSNVAAVYDAGTLAARPVPPLGSGDAAAAATPPAVALVGHEGYVSAARFLAPDRLLTGSGDGTLGEWDLHIVQRTGTYSDHAGDVTSAAVHPRDAAMFVSGSCDGTVKVWDARAPEDAACVRSYSGFGADVNAVDFFPSGAAVAGASDDSTVRVFDLRSSGPVGIYTEDRIKCGATSLAFSASGRLLFAGYGNASAIAWEIVSAEGTLHELTGHSERVTCLALNPAGQALATGSWDKRCVVWA